MLAFKSYYEWKQAGGNGVWKYVENSKPSVDGSSDMFVNLLTSAGQKSTGSGSHDDVLHNNNQAVCKLKFSYNQSTAITVKDFVK